MALPVLPLGQFATEKVVGSDTELITHLDEDFVMACEVPARRAAVGGTPICPETDPATWVAWRPNCCPQSPRYMLICDVCKATYQAWIAQFALISCGDCGAKTGGFLSYTPLNRKS